MELGDKRKIGLIGYACLQADNIAKLIDSQSEVLGQTILTCGNRFNLAVDFDSDLHEDMLKFEITYSLNDGDNEEDAVAEIHATIEDIFTYYVVDSDEDVLNSIIRGIASICRVDNVYLLGISKLKRIATSVVLDKLRRYCSTEEVEYSLDELYLKQYSTEPVIQLYNAIFVAVKYAMICKLKKAFPIPVESIQVSKDCITFIGSIDKSGAEFLFNLVRDMRYDSKVPFSSALECINLTVNGNSRNVYIYSSYPINTPKHSLLLEEAEYLLYCDSADHLETSSEEHIKELELYNDILPDKKTDYILVPTFVSPLDPNVVDQLVSDKKNRTFLMFAGSEDLKWESGSADDNIGGCRKYFCGNSEGNTDSLELVHANDFIEESDEDVETLMPELTSSYGNFSAASLLKEVRKTGLDGFNDYTVLGFEDELPTESLEVIEEEDEVQNGELNYPKRTYRISNKTDIVFYVADNFNLRDVPDIYIDRMLESLAYDRQEAEAVLLNEKFLNLNLGLIEQIVTNAKNAYLDELEENMMNFAEENGAQLGSSVVYKKLTRLLLSTSCSGIFKMLHNEVTKAKFNLPTDNATDEALEYVDTEIKLAFLVSIYKSMTAKANQYWRHSNANLLGQDKIVNIQDFEQVLDKIL